MIERRRTRGDIYSFGDNRGFVWTRVENSVAWDEMKWFPREGPTCELSPVADMRQQGTRRFCWLRVASLLLILRPTLLKNKTTMSGFLYIKRIREKIKKGGFLDSLEMVYSKQIVQAYKIELTSKLWSV